mmetsp:Transcript_2161/g.5916  ORF Transcript_2161/g.5916 Transcript_2161/m.5916 type:complete len:264 (-) Transcript_2161:716-1507(-)
MGDAPLPAMAPLLPAMKEPRVGSRPAMDCCRSMVLSHDFFSAGSSLIASRNSSNETDPSPSVSIRSKRFTSLSCSVAASPAGPAPHSMKLSSLMSSSGESSPLPSASSALKQNCIPSMLPPPMIMPSAHMTSRLSAYPLPSESRRGSRESNGRSSPKPSSSNAPLRSSAHIPSPYCDITWRILSSAWTLPERDFGRGVAPEDLRRFMATRRRDGTMTAHAAARNLRRALNFFSEARDCGRCSLGAVCCTIHSCSSTSRALRRR